MRVAAVVDPYSAGSLLGAELGMRGFGRVAVQSTGEVPDVFRTTYDPSVFEEVVVHRGDLEETAARLRGLGVDCIVPGCELGVELAEELDVAPGQLDQVLTRARQGALTIQVSLSPETRQAIRRIDLEFDEPVEASAFEGIGGVHSAETRGNTVVVSFEGSVNGLLRTALQHDVVNVNSREADLEQIFLAYYHGNGDVQ